MCTLMTFSRDVYKDNEIGILNQIRLDSTMNDDGVSLLLQHVDGQVSNFRAMDIELVQTLLDTLPWERFWLHQRAATGHRVGTEFAHGFCQDGVWYMHNGIIRNPEADRLPVDSMVIGRWISRNQQYQRLAKEAFANVFLIAPKQNVYTVWRSTTGSLFTDNEGNYSTRYCFPCINQATPGQTSFHIRDPEFVKAEQEAAEREAAERRMKVWESRSILTSPGLAYNYFNE